MLVSPIFTQGDVTGFHYNKDYNITLQVITPSPDVTGFHYNKDYNR